ncbi:MAG: hypothetical protein K6A41_06745 [Bacteroidales bacterium]|nr:hypothetical protein [Bacteroidales bacterium]
MASGKSKPKPLCNAIKGRNGFVLFSAFFFCCLCLTNCKRAPEVTEFVLPDTVQLQTGDIVFRVGTSKESRAVVTVDRKSIYSHIGMVVYDDGQWKVLHAVPNERATKEEKDSVKLEPIGVFFRSDRAGKGCVCRYPLEGDTLKLQQRALDLYRRHLLFDNKFDDQDTNAFYCTELVWFLYQQTLGVDLSEGRRHHIPALPEVILCSDIFQNPKIRVVYRFERPPH